MGFACWAREVRQETERRIRANNPEYNSQFNYANNYIKTSKYSLLTFLPRNLFEQFQRLANFYFLCLLVLQMIPQISSLTPWTTAVPLVVVLSLTALKDAIDDIQRHQSDNQVNNRLSKVLRNGQLVEERWHKVQVGDIILWRTTTSWLPTYCCCLLVSQMAYVTSRRQNLMVKLTSSVARPLLTQLR